MIDKSFGFDTAVEEAQRAINAAHVEVESVDNGVGIVKLMGRYSGKCWACYTNNSLATPLVALASFIISYSSFYSNV